MGGLGPLMNGPYGSEHLRINDNSINEYDEDNILQQQATSDKNLRINILMLVMHLLIIQNTFDSMFYGCLALRYK